MAISLPALKPATLDRVNIGLMIVALGLAYLLPFELFLFSYAVLGPLHYLTEISWLHKKNYFIGGSGQGKITFALISLALGLLITLSNFGDDFFSWIMNREIRLGLSNYGTQFIFLALGISFVFVLFQNTTKRVAGMAILAIFAFMFNMDQAQTTIINHEGKEIGGTFIDKKDKYLAITNVNLELQGGEMLKGMALLLKRNEKGQWGYADQPIHEMSRFSTPSKAAVIDAGGELLSFKDENTFHFGAAYKATGLFFSFFLPTIIHVFLFTALFMWFGALKSGSRIGLFSVAFLFFCGLLPFIWDPQIGAYAVSDSVRKSYDVSFYDLNLQIMRLFNRVENLNMAESMVYASSFGLSVTRFIAFAYTYHYLNWFSKTSIIQWHKVPLLNLAVVALLWISSVALYLWDYRTGLQALFFLSFLHVFMEFPLNVQSVLGISRHYLSIFRPRPAKVSG